MGPGPSDVHKRILNAMARQTIGHLDPAFIEMMDETKQMLKYAFMTENELTMPISAPGSAGMEACFANLVEPGDKVIVCINGVFGTRMKENVIRVGGDAVIINDDWGKPVDPQKVEQALIDNPDAKILAFVHAETSTGAISDAKQLCELANKHSCLSIVDAVTSLALSLGLMTGVLMLSILAHKNAYQQCQDYHLLVLVKKLYTNLQIEIRL